MFFYEIYESPKINFLSPVVKKNIGFPSSQTETTDIL